LIFFPFKIKVFLNRIQVDPNAWKGKRYNIVNELVETEKAYLSDLELLKEVKNQFLI